LKARLKDVSLYFDVDGAQLVPIAERMVERPTVLLLHGGPGFDHSHYKPAFTEFRDIAQLVFLDHRGQGRSDRSRAEQWNLATWADDVADLCATLSIERPILLGASFGGFVAFAAATRYPKLASGLVLLGTAAHVSIERVVARFGELGGSAAEAAARAMFRDPEDPRVIDNYINTCFPLYSTKGFDPLLTPRSILNFDVAAHFFCPQGEYGKFDYRRALAQLHTPTLMLHGELDPIVPVDLARQTFAAFPPGVASLEVFADCGHDIARDKWEGIAPLIRRFIQSCTYAGSA
jgi:pimeloyl-ACP methyl ester carboxylesterase